ncbi:DNA-J related domain-containing protein [Marinomonas spartinae]|uniref:DNA-J related domain-containing protein n=1 Tax=Marinomonas spartinae TaxID=1792290 RepID=UPI0018F23D62|nr:DNA-J related domain-containing protein [Marinomonas spartinae]MBJ7554584.1 DnaJ domain-containing protein [Marinomonas spartinae]
MRNPLIGPILSILRDHPQGVGEFYILKNLREQVPELHHLADDPNLQLFRQHFLIMNALYQLQSNLWQEESLTLSINAMHIRLIPNQDMATSSSQDVSDSVDAKLAAYYLDWSEYEKTSEDDVIRLLDSFYKGINNLDNKTAALEILHIDSKNPTKEEIKKQYRKLAHQAHPDRGGDTEQFISLRQAYECLMY